MASRAIWEGTISFGLVQIPVGLHTAESRDDIDFDLLDRRDMAPVGYQRVNKSTDKPVEWDDIVKGYEYSPGKYVVLEKEDFKRANVKSTQTVDIVQFADADEIDVMALEKPYYLVPAKKGHKAYALLREALKKSGKVGIARVVVRTRESVGAVMVRGNALILELLRYDHELKSDKDFDLPGAYKLSAGEMKMAQRLIDDLTAPFKPSEFKDTYRDDLLAFIKKKVKEGDTETTPEPIPEPEASNVVDIMALLRRSLDGKGRGGAANDAPAKKSTKKKTSAAKKTTRKAAAKKTAKRPAKKTAAKKTAAKKKSTKRSAHAPLKKAS